jgi:DsbC/DsbD-like thiol-disulfide interchange protein
MHLFAWLVAASLVAPVVSSLPEPAWLKKTSRVAVQAFVEPARATPGQAVTLVLEVTPLGGVHVYAPGSESYTTPTVRLDPVAGVRLTGAATFPDAEPFVFGDLKEVVEVYKRSFRIRQPLTVDPATARRAPGSLRVTGTLEYQACTDRVCFPPQTEPFEAIVRTR